MSIKVKDLAKELGVTNDEVLEQLHKLYVDADDENSPVDDKIVGLVRIKLGGSVAPEKPVKKKAAKKTPAKKASKTKTKKVSDEKAGEVKPKKKTTKAKVSEKKEDKEAKPKTKAKKDNKAPLKGIQIVKRAEVPVEEKKPEKVEEKKEETKEESVEEKPKKKKKFSLGGITIVKRAEPGEVIDASDRKAKSKKLKKSERSKKAAETAADKARRRAGGDSGKRWSRMRQVAKSAKKAEQPQAPIERKGPQKLQVHFPISIRTLAPMMSKKPNELLQYMMQNGIFANINQDLDEDMVRLMFDHFGFEIEVGDTIESIEEALVKEHQEEAEAEEAAGEIKSRAPIVTFMGHVDHGKTSLLDYIRKTMVTKGEKGGITQHIGSYRVETEKGAVCFLDTPGHAAFTAMRARGANATDVVVLVVAADDGVMPQTKEAIDHAKAANVPIVVAINKCDLPGASPDRVRRDLQQEGLMSEDWGGDTVMVEVSAQTGEGIDTLVEMLMLESELLELKANPQMRARGVVIEGKKTSGQGIVATFLVKNGTLKQGDIVFTGSFYGRVKAMNNDIGERVPDAGPSTPVEVLGLTGVPEAGDEFFSVKDEKKAKTLADLKQAADKKKKMAGSQRITLEDLHDRIQQGEVKELKIILKADVQGSIEAIQSSMEELSTDEVKLNFVHNAVGNINESDAMLAMVSNAVIIGFHVKIDTKAEELAKSEKVDVRLYDVIYEAIADVQAAMEGLLEPEEVEEFQGRAEVREIFSTRNGKVSGCMVTKGTIHRKDRVRVMRGQEQAWDGEIAALKRFKDDVRDVREGFECGISVRNFDKIKTGDQIEAYSIKKVARRLEKKK